MIYTYPCELTPDEDGSLMAAFPDDPEAITGGKDRTAALTMAEDALATALSGYGHAQWRSPHLANLLPDRNWSRCQL